MSDIGEESERDNTLAEEATAEVNSQRTPRRRLTAASVQGQRRSPVVLLDDVSGIFSHYNANLSSHHDLEDECNDFELLVPRLVLERVTIGGRRRSSATQRHNGETTKEKLSSASRELFSQQNPQGSSESAPDPAGESSLDEMTRRETVTAATKTAGRKKPPRQTPVSSGQPAGETLPKELTSSKEANVTPSPDTKRSPHKTACSASSTPCASNESFREFQQRILAVDPLEGPSWLFGPNNKAKKTQLAKKIVERMSQYAAEAAKMREEEAKRMEDAEQPSNTLDKVEKQNETPRGKDNDSSSAHLNDAGKENRAEGDGGNGRGHCQRRRGTDSVSPVKPAKRARFAESLPTSTSGETVPTKTESGARLSVPQETDDTGPRPKRRAAAAAATSLREVPLGTKLRQGDPTSNSVYSDYVPQTKEAKKRRTSKKKA
jgi:hypothetical protein